MLKLVCSKVEQKLEVGQVCGVSGRFATGSRRLAWAQFGRIEIINEYRVVTESGIGFVEEIEVVRGVINGGVLL